MSASGAIAGAHLFLGDSTVTDPAARELCAALVPSHRRELDLEVLRWPERGLDEAVAAVRQVGMFSAARTVWVRGYGSGPERDDEVRAVLELLEEGLGAGCALVVSAASIDRRSRLFRAFLSRGVVHDMAVATDRWGRTDTAALAEVVRQRLAANGLARPSAALVEAIVARAGPVVGELLQEIDRFALGLDSGQTPTPALVADRFRDQAEAWVFDLTDAVSRRDLPSAAATLSRLLAADEPPLRLVATLGSHMATLIEARRILDAIGAGSLGARMGDFSRGAYTRLPAGFRKRYSAGRAWHLLTAARSFAPAELRELHHGVLALDLALKSAGAAPEALLFAFLGRACRRRRRSNPGAAVVA